MSAILVFGAGGHGKVALYALLAQGAQVLGFVDDNVQGVFCGLPVFQASELLNLQPCMIHFAIGNNRIRKRLQLEWVLKGGGAQNAIHPESFVYPNTQIGNGCLMAARAIVGPDAVIGEGSIINHNAIVDHDCMVGPFCHVAPGATLGGGVRLGEGCLVGAGATILPCLNIGRNVTIGAGATVIQDVPDGATVVGVPARLILKDVSC